MVGTKALNIKTNENETDKFANVKKFGAPNTEITSKRAALGDIQNRGVLRAVSIKEKDLKDTKNQNGLLNAKARVDSQWKKGALGSSTTTATTSSSSTSSTTAVTKTTKVVTKSTTTTSATLRSQVAAGIGGERKILTRSNSVRLGAANGTATTGGIGLQRQGSNNLILGQYKTKTVTTKLVENKVSQVKIVNKTSKNEEKVTSNGERGGAKVTTLRREDSNLSRKSLTRLKAALNRDPSKVLTKSSSLTANAVSKAQGIAKAVEETKSKEASASASAVAENLPKVELKHELPVIEAVKIISAPTHSSKLLEDIEDIDAGDSENLVLVSDYVNDIYDYLYSLEIQHSIEPDHMDGQEEVTPRMRAVLIDWINEVASQFHLVIETFQMTVGIIDRYLQKVKDTKRPHLQLVGVTALFIAAKYEELFPPAISDFVYITDNAYTARQIRQMELKIFKTLDYNLSRPLPIHFLRRYSKATYALDNHHAMSKYFCELSMVEYDLAAYKPSEIAAASLFLALHLINDNANLPTGFRNKHWPATLEHYSRYSPEHLKPISRKIATIARNAPTAKLKAVYVKYQQMKFHEVSKKSELYGPLIDSIIKSKN